MNVSEFSTGTDHELILLCEEPAARYRSIIALHSTALGPAVGGTRFYPYTSDDEALTDVLRLSRGMTYKNAVAGLPLGGGKAVIIGDNQRTDRERLFRAHGRAIESLAGRFITGEDVGTSLTDMEFVHLETRHVGGITGKGGDPSPWTARGVFRGMQAAARQRWGTPALVGKTVAIQGCGNVGFHLARELYEAGASLIVTDIDPACIKRVTDEFAVVTVAPEEIFAVPADIFAPCAFGAVLNDQTIPQLRTEIVAGAANNQLLEPQHDAALAERGILYAPDYVINAGGVISGTIGILGWSAGQMRHKVEEIYDTLSELFESARNNGITTGRAADQLAEQRLRAADNNS